MSRVDPVNRQNLFDCSGLVAVITGGGSGIGLVMARALARNGATVYILGRRFDKLVSAADSITATLSSSHSPPHSSGNVIPLQCDITSQPSLEAAASQISSETGYVNLVIANAGIMGPSHTALLPRTDDSPLGPVTVREVQEHLWNCPIEDLTEVYKVNIAGAIYTAVAFLGLLDEGNKKGNVKQTSQVLVTSSIGAFNRSWQSWLIGGLGYHTSKGAVNHLVNCLASFLVQWKIRVNGLAAGPFNSEMMQIALGDTDISAEGALPKSLAPLGRGGRDEELAGTVLYFASEAGGYCSGTVHIFDGGRLGVMP